MPLNSPESSLRSQLVGCKHRASTVALKVVRIPGHPMEGPHSGLDAFRVGRSALPLGGSAVPHRHTPCAMRGSARPHRQTSYAMRGSALPLGGSARPHRQSPYAMRGSVRPHRQSSYAMRGSALPLGGSAVPHRQLP